MLIQSLKNPLIVGLLTLTLLQGCGGEASTPNRTAQMMNPKAQTVSASARNVLGGALKACCFQPKTGFYRDGFCHTGPQDMGTHTVCAVVTDAFLEYTKTQGNDLSTPIPEFDFPGLTPGDRWCLCASRWYEAYRAGCAPKVDLAATHEKTLEFVPLETLKAFAAE